MKEDTILGTFRANEKGFGFVVPEDESIEKDIFIPGKSINEFEKMMKDTNCDAVMIGRGCIGNPWLIRDINNYLIQFQSDILDCKIVRPTCLETTALGAAYLAGLAKGIWKSKNELKIHQKINQIFVPRMNKEKRDALYDGWLKAVNATRMFK